jgi:hypothetical protein
VAIYSAASTRFAFFCIPRRADGEALVKVPREERGKRPVMRV